MPHTSESCFYIHKTMVPNRGWQWDHNAFYIIFHVQCQFQSAVRAYWNKFGKCPLKLKYDINLIFTLYYNFIFRTFFEICFGRFFVRKGYSLKVIQQPFFYFALKIYYYYNYLLTLLNITTSMSVVLFLQF